MNSDFSLLVFADDWGRHPSSCQHLVRELLPLLPELYQLGGYNLQHRSGPALWLR